jgi:hypothetical protein
MDVKVGDRILIGKYSGSEIKIDGEEYVILREDEILAVIFAESLTPFPSENPQGGKPMAAKHITYSRHARARGVNKPSPTP